MEDNSKESDLTDNSGKQNNNSINNGSSQQSASDSDTKNIVDNCTKDDEEALLEQMADIHVNTNKELEQTLICSEYTGKHFASLGQASNLVAYTNPNPN